MGLRKILAGGMAMAVPRGRRNLNRIRRPLAELIRERIESSEVDDQTVYAGADSLPLSLPRRSRMSAVN